MTAADADSATQLTFRRLSLLAPQDYRNWVRAGIAFVLVGYSLAFASIQLEQPWAKQRHPTELYVVAAALCAIWLERRGRLQAAARLILAAVWVEMHISLLEFGVRAAVGAVFPGVVTGVILFFGVRAGQAAALSSLVSVTGAVALGPPLGRGPGRLQHAQKLEALGRLAGGVAHDFNNLLMAVGGYGEALSRHADERVREIAESLIGLRQRAAGLTGHLLAFARKGMTQPRSMDLARAVNEMPRLLRPLVGSRVALEIEAPQPVFIHADPAQIEQVLLNLALNARDAMPDGGLLRMSCGCSGERVELCVTDTGHGMDDATRSSAFEPFFTTKPRSQGTGLGLALVHGIMEASGGTIQLESAPGRGTRFTLSWRALALGVEHHFPLELQREREN